MDEILLQFECTKSCNALIADGLSFIKKGTIVQVDKRQYHEFIKHRYDSIVVRCLNSDDDKEIMSWDFNSNFKQKK